MRNSVSATENSRFNQRRLHSSLFRDIAANGYSYILMLPAFIYTFIYGYATMPYMIIAFQRYDFRKGILNSDWIGFKNFEFFFRSVSAVQVTWNTFFLNILFLAAVTFTALALSLMLNEMASKQFKKVIQTTYLFPSFISWIIVSYIVFNFLSTEKGIINGTLASIGMSKVQWYNDSKYWPAILTIIRIWKDAGITSIIYLATIAGIDFSLYEAARIDGASKWSQIRYITLPLLAPTISILTLLSIGRIFYGDFGMIYSLIGDNGLLYPTVDVIDTYVFRALRQVGDPANAMAVGLYQSLIGFIMVYGANLIIKKYFPEGAIY